MTSQDEISDLETDTSQDGAGVISMGLAAVSGCTATLLLGGEFYYLFLLIFASLFFAVFGWWLRGILQE